MKRFQRNNSVELPESICQHEHFLNHKIFMAGEMFVALKGKGIQENTFILFTMSGNPKIHFFQKTKDGSLDGGYFDIMMARAEEDDHDIMFIGGDFNQQFSAWKRSTSGSTETTAPTTTTEACLASGAQCMDMSTFTTIGNCCSGLTCAPPGGTCQ